MEQITEYIKPELLVVVFVLYIFGAGLKKTTLIRDKYIPLILGAAGIGLCTVWVLASCPLGSPREIAMAVFTSVVQGILVAGAGTYVNQVVKQMKKEE